jgi:Na+/proline symporter
MTSVAHPIDIGIFVVFLAVTLVVGIGYGRRVKTLKDYALGGKNFSTLTLTATIVATWMGGDAIFYIITNVYKGGLYFIIPILGWAACVVLTGQLAARMGEFLNNISVAEAMGDLYGKRVHIITAIFGILSCIGCIAIQLKVTSMVITLMWGFTGLWVTVAAGVIVIAYSAFGGIRAVTYTDVFQFLTFGAFIPIIALVIWNNLKSPSMVINTLAHNSVFSFTEVVGWNSKFMGAVALLAFFVIPSMDPAIFQRVAMGRNVKQTRQAFTYAAVPFLIILLFMIWISVLLLSADNNLPSDDLVSYILHRSAHPGLRGLFGTGIVAMAMSTSDSYINASAVLLSNDIAKPLNMAIQHPVRAARSFAVVGGALALMLAINTEDLLELALLPGSFYMPIVTVPLIMAICGFRSSNRAALVGIIFGFTVALIWKIFPGYTEIHSIALGMLANLIGLMGSHYLLGEPGGWQKVAPSSPLGLERAARRQAWQRRLRAIRNFRLYPYLQQNLPTQEGFYFFLGLYAMAATYAALYTVGDTEVMLYQDLYKGIYYTILPATTAFLTFPIWPPTMKSRRFMTLFWPLGIWGYPLLCRFAPGNYESLQSHASHGHDD